MAPITTQGSAELGARIRERRAELRQSVDEAAKVAGVSGETWRRYEAGGSIRRDKVRAVARALKVSDLSELGAERSPYQPFWRDEDQLGMWGGGMGRDLLAKALLAGSTQCDELDAMFSGLLEMPAGSHRAMVGGTIFINLDLPGRWEPRYDWEFYYRLRGRFDHIEQTFSHHEGEPPLDEVVVCFADVLALRRQLQSGLASLIDGEDPAGDGCEGADEDKLQAQFMSDLGLPVNLLASIERLFDHTALDPAFDSFAHITNWFMPGLLHCRLVDRADEDGPMQYIAKDRVSDPDPAPDPWGGDDY